MRTRLTRHFIEFFESERSSGIALLSATILALLAANSLYGQEFLELWHIKLGFDLAEVHLQYDILHWINDGLMAVFFLLIGLEIEREIYKGELSDFKNAALPIFAAVGGMLAPALIYLAINQGLPSQNGFGIPMATDIAFALGALSLLGNRVPVSIKIFLAAFAIIDDLGAMLVIAIFYAHGFSLIYLLLALAVYGFLLVLNWRGVNFIPAYLLPGLLMWYLMLQSGVHASIAGVLLAFALPFRDGGLTSPSYKIEHFLNKPVALIIMPIFALANSGILFSKDLFGQIISANTLGIFSGLLIGKPLGIILFSVLAIKLGLARLPGDVDYKQLLGVGFLGGIGFTMSMFITILAFGETATAQSSKIAIMLGSLVSGIIGILILSRSSFDTKRSFHDQNRHSSRSG
ncbi:MAG: Na+/H+ antiporter NhaA [Anaerolineaceae bacterium]|nr:Na+/H+ antiporter NhaA [Anaerolineaceae bacterium]